MTYKIILVMPSHSNFATAIQKNLEFHNFEVKFINSSPENIQKIKLPRWINIYTLFRKLFLADFSYKDKAKDAIKQRIIAEEISKALQNNTFDYVLVIRPDLIDSRHLKILKACSNHHFIGYQWNGIERFPKTLSSVDLFDHFFVFDPEDLSNPDYRNYKFQGCTNFYFDMYSPKPKLHTSTVAYFVGLHFDDRSQPIDHCAQALIEHGITLDFNIKFRHGDQADAQTQYHTQEIKFINQNIDYEDNLQHINQADILVDVVNPVHKGLSFRTFEALYYQKKLITNNAQIHNYDFYHPNNILIWDGKNLDTLKDFLDSPYVAVDTQIREKYSFGNWIRYILKKAPYQQIQLPLQHP